MKQHNMVEAKLLRPDDNLSSAIRIIFFFFNTSAQAFLLSKLFATRQHHIVFITKKSVGFLEKKHHHCFNTTRRKKQKEDEDDCFDKHGIISPFTQSCAPYGCVELLHRISKGNNSFSWSKWIWRDGFKKHFWGVSGH